MSRLLKQVAERDAWDSQFGQDEVRKAFQAWRNRIWMCSGRLFGGWDWKRLDSEKWLAFVEGWYRGTERAEELKTNVQP